MLKLSTKWAPRLISQPETGMDYQIVSVILADGRRFQDIVIVGGVISTVPGYSDIPFSEAEIEDIVLTPGKRNIR